MNVLLLVELKDMLATFNNHTLNIIMFKMKKSCKKRFLIFLKIQNEDFEIIKST